MLGRVTDKGNASAQSVLEIAPFLDREDLLFLGRKSIAKVANAESVGLIESSLGVGGRTSVVAMAGLAKLKGAESAEAIEAVMQTADDHTRLYAAAELLNFNQVEGLQEIVELLHSEELMVRRLAGGWLRFLTVGEVVYYPDADPIRGESLAKAKDWLERGPELSDLALPFDLRPQFAGRIL